MTDFVWATLLNLAVLAAAMAATMIILRRIYSREAIVEVENESVFKDRFAIAYQSCEFEATAGGRLSNYFDADKLLMTVPDFVEEISSRVVDTLRSYPSAKICFIEKDSGPIGMLTIASFVAYKLGRQVSTIRPRREVWKMAVEGASIGQGDQVVLIQDVFTTGFQIVQATRPLEKAGASVIAAVALVDRQQERDDELATKNIKLYSITTLLEIQERIDKQGTNLKNRREE